MNLSSLTTVEENLNFRKEEISYRKSENLNTSSSKQEFARRAFEHIQSQYSVDQAVNNANEYIMWGLFLYTVFFSKLTDGWPSNFSNKINPPATQKDIENYLIKRSRRACDCQKMACYRQYIQGHKFCKEKYIYKIMAIRIIDEHRFCYIRSKCHASIKKNYTQWVFVSKVSSMIISLVSCACPEG